MLLCMCKIQGMVISRLTGLNAEKFGMSAKAEDLMRQQYLVPRKSVKKLREMSRREGVSAGELARRAIEAYTSGNVLTEPEEEAALRAVLKDIHAQVRAALTRIDASLSEIRASERRLADGTFRAQVAAETRAWFDAHSDEAQGIVEFFAPSHLRSDKVRLGHRTVGRSGGYPHGGEEGNEHPARGPRATVDPYRNLD
jgi:hypothetical protein